jgi:hypothetical protein
MKMPSFLRRPLDISKRRERLHKKCQVMSQRQRDAVFVY